jgi:hypothetical protein
MCQRVAFIKLAMHGILAAGIAASGRAISQGGSLHGCAAHNTTNNLENNSFQLGDNSPNRCLAKTKKANLNIARLLNAACFLCQLELAFGKLKQCSRFAKKNHRRHRKKLLRKNSSRIIF